MAETEAKASLAFKKQQGREWEWSTTHERERIRGPNHIGPVHIVRILIQSLSWGKKVINIFPFG
jgi:hypothetical protein